MNDLVDPTGDLSAKLFRRLFRKGDRHDFTHARGSSRKNFEIPFDENGRLPCTGVCRYRKVPLHIERFVLLAGKHCVALRDVHDFGREECIVVTVSPSSPRPDAAWRLFSPTPPHAQH